MSASIVHRCHAAGCPQRIPPILLFCPRHWQMVPKAIQFRVVAAYRLGQEHRKDPTLQWCLAADAAVAHVAGLEGRDVAVTFCAAFYPAQPRAQAARP